jgi:cysteine desulfurase
LAGAVGLAAALELAAGDLPARNAHAVHLRDRLLDGIPAVVPDVLVTGPRDRARRAANNASLCFRGIEAEPLLMQLDMAGVAASAGSACTTASVEPSHVLLAMGVPADVARGSLRLTTGKDTTDADIDYLLDVLPRFVARLRGLATARA